MTSREFKYHNRKKWKFINWDNLPEQEKHDHICEHEECSHFATVKCQLDFFNEETNEWEIIEEWFCTDHAQEEGYCMGCGTFIAGSDMQWANDGFCDNCFDQIRDNDRFEEEDFPDGTLDY